jgi:hypothetical protein
MNVIPLSAFIKEGEFAKVAPTKVIGRKAMQAQNCMLRGEKGLSHGDDKASSNSNLGVAGNGIRIRWR